MDVDVELLGKLDEFLDHEAFSGYENDNHMSTGIIGFAKGGEWIKFLLDYYDNRNFVKFDGTYDMIINVIIIASMTK